MTNAGTSARVEELLAAMTTAEKAAQLNQYFSFDLPGDNPAAREMAGQPQMVEDALARGGAGALLFVTDPAVINRLQRQCGAGSRHGIPALFGFDVIHGLRTILPVPIALAATWDADLIERAQTVAAREARAVGIHWTFAPNVDIARDPRWGRMMEGAGEDAHLGAVVATAQVRGFQGAHIGGAERIVAGPKHFAGYGAALGGRDYDEADLSDQELWNTYLPPFQAAIDAGAGNIMSAYMDLNGVPATGNRWLLHDVLRDALGFDGFVVSDANSVRDLVTHHFAADLTDAGARALEAGVDLEMAIADPAFDHLVDAIDQGSVGAERLDAGRARRGPAAQRRRAAAAGRGRRRRGRGARTARRLAARHARTVGVRLRPGRDGDDRGRLPPTTRRPRGGHLRARCRRADAWDQLDLRHVRSPQHEHRGVRRGGRVRPCRTVSRCGRRRDRRPRRAPGHDRRERLPLVVGPAR